MEILYIASSEFPGNNAYSTRIYGICSSLIHTGNNVTVLTDYSSVDDVLEQYNGINIIACTNVKFSNRTLFHKVYDYLYQTGRMVRVLGDILTKRSFDCVIMSSMFERAEKIISLLKEKKIPIILESCEWFEEYNWSFGKWNPKYKKYVYAWENIFTKVDGVIAISRLLEKHYSKYVNNVIRIPTIMEIDENIDFEVRKDDKLKLIFIGSIAAGKDRLIDVIESLIVMKRNNIEIHIYGPSKNDVRKQLGNSVKFDNIIDKQIFIYGRVPHREINSACKNCDMGIILRPDRKQSHAGFPTKLAEYMAAGIPVLVNDTGDICLYVNNGINGYVLPTRFSNSDIISLLETILKNNMQKNIELRKNSYFTAKDKFNYLQYSEILQDFLTNVIKQHL